MSRKFLVPVLLVAQVVVFLLLASVLARQPAASASGAAAPQDRPQEQSAVNGQYLWSYAAKFVCGYQRTATPGQPAPGEPIVKPGNYATEINIHNPATIAQTFSVSDVLDDATAATVACPVTLNLNFALMAAFGMPL